MKSLSLLALSTASLLISGAVAAQTISIATLPPGAITNVQGQVMAKVVQGKTDLKTRVVPIGGAIGQFTAVDSGQAEFSIWEVNGVTAATQGWDHYKGQVRPNLRVAARLMAFPIGIMVNKDSNIRSITDLKGKRMPTGYTADPDLGTHLQAILLTSNVTYKDLKSVPTTGLIRGADDFKAGKTVGAQFAVGAPKVNEVNAAVGGIRFLNLNNDAGANKRIRDLRPDYFLMTVKPNPRFVGIEKPTTVLGVHLTLITGAGVKDDVVYKFVKALHDNKPELAKGHPSFNGFAPKMMAPKFAIAKYHPGAIKFYKEAGVWQGN